MVTYNLTLDDSVELGYPSISICGGEPLSRQNQELAFWIAEEAEKRGLVIQSIITNASWAVTPEKAEQMIAKVKNAPGTRPVATPLAVSSDQYHEEFVPFERVANAVNAIIKFDGYEIRKATIYCLKRGNDNEQEFIQRLIDEMYKSDPEKKPDLSFLRREAWEDITEKIPTCSGLKSYVAGAILGPSGEEAVILASPKSLGNFYLLTLPDLPAEIEIQFREVHRIGRAGNISRRELQYPSLGERIKEGQSPNGISEVAFVEADGRIRPSPGLGSSEENTFIAGHMDRGGIKAARDFWERDPVIRVLACEDTCFELLHQLVSKYTNEYDNLFDHMTCGPEFLQAILRNPWIHLFVTQDLLDYFKGQESAEMHK